MVKKHKIGASGIEVAALGMGCWAFGGGSYWGAQAQRDVNEVVSLALDEGINYFDTAEVYNDGESETALGIALNGRRREAVIGTKVSTSNTRPDVLRRHCEDSLKRLKTDYIDLYMLHWPINPKAIEHFSDDPSLAANPPSVEETFETMLALQKEGKIREIGISNHGVTQMKEVLRVCPGIAVNQLAYNLVSRAIEKEILPFCIEHNIGVLGYMAYQQGLLTGKMGLDDLTGPRAHSRHFHFSRGGEFSRHTEAGAEQEILALLPVIDQIAENFGVPAAAVSMAWAMKKQGVVNTLVGSRNRSQLIENIRAAQFELPEDAYRTLNAASQPVWDVLGDNPDYYQNREESRVW